MDILKLIISQYILVKFWKNFIIIFLIFTGIFFLADIISNIGLLFKYNAGIFYYIIYSILKIPQGLKFIIPISTLTASMYTFSSLNRNFEVISFRTLKINKKFIIIPLVLSGILLSLISFVINEFVLPEVNYYAKYINIVKIRKKTNFAVSKANNIWYYKKNFIIRIKFLYFDSGILNDITILQFDNSFNLVKRIDADYGFKKKDKWVLINPVTFNFKNGNILNFAKSFTIPMPIKLEKSDFFVIEQKSNELNLFSLIKLIKFLKKNHINIENYIIVIFDKIFYPFIAIIFILLGFFLNIRPAKTGALLSIILAISLGAGYFILNGFLISLSKIKLIPIVIGPCLTFFIYILVLFLLNKKFKY